MSLQSTVREAGRGFVFVVSSSRRLALRASCFHVFGARLFRRSLLLSRESFPIRYLYSKHRVPLSFRRYTLHTKQHTHETRHTKHGIPAPHTYRTTVRPTANGTKNQQKHQSAYIHKNYVHEQSDDDAASFTAPDAARPTWCSMLGELVILLANCFDWTFKRTHNKRTYTQIYSSKQTNSIIACRESRIRPQRVQNHHTHG